jgi:hypothetical protein
MQSKLMEGLESQSEEAAHVLLDKCHKMPSTLEESAHRIDPMLADSTSNPTIVDCVAVVTPQFSNYVHGLDPAKGHLRSLKLYRAFSRNRSTEMNKVPGFIREHAGILSVQ